MCGIVGYVGRKAVVPLIIDCLKHLEYRGYDSSGIAYMEKSGVAVYKASGKLVNLTNTLPSDALRKEPSTNGNRVGIGHIRWATHGAANDINAHPHLSSCKTIALVHNGIIENYYDIKQELIAKGYQFVSETDTECVVHLIEDLKSQMPGVPFIEVIRKALERLKGAYAFTVISQEHPGTLFAVRNHAPLVIGVGKDDYVVASDTVAIVEHTDQVIYLKDYEIAEISANGINLMTIDGKPLTPQVITLNTGPLSIDKKGFKHFMLKEIHEQSDVIRHALTDRLLDAELPVMLIGHPGSEEAKAFNDLLKSVSRIQIIGCGTSFHAALVGKYFIEELVRVPVEVEAAGEYRYRHPIVDDKTLFVCISQSGETADTLEALRQAAKQGAKVIALTNREDSTIARESDFIISVRAGVEVSVAATKSFLAQLVCLYLLGLNLSELRNTVPADKLASLKAEFLKIPVLIESYLSDTGNIAHVARKLASVQDVIFMARTFNFPVALEGALKLKEISYIHAEGYSGSELKHGPIALLDEHTPVVAVLSPGIVFDKMISNCQEVRARDSKLVIVTTDQADLSQHQSLFEDVLLVPHTNEYFSPLLTIIPLQLLAYHIAEHLGKDVDQPRNLAKSVTVE